MNTTVAEIAAFVGGTVVGDSSTPLTGISGIRQAGPGDLTFLADSRYVPFLETTNASAILVSLDVMESEKALIQVSDPYLALTALLKRVQAETAYHPTDIHPTAVISEDVEMGRHVAVGAHVCIANGCRIGDGVTLYPGVYIGHGCEIGAGTLIYPNAVIREGTRIGKRCIVHSGAALGSDGFGFASVDGKHEKVPQVGTVVIGDDVEIGANTAVDRATFGQTIVGEGTKIDNLVQIGHNVRVGKHTVICGNAGIAGSTVVGDRVTIAAGAGIAGHIEVGEGAVIGAYSGVSKSIKPGRAVFGYPAVEHSRSKRIIAAQRQLPDLVRVIRDLEKRVAELEGQLDGKAEDNR